MHGRPDAYLTEMQRILKEAFDIDISLPTISRTLKLKGCMKGFNKTRHIRTAMKKAGQDQGDGSRPNEIPSLSSPASHRPRSGLDITQKMVFEKDLERHLEQHLGQSFQDDSDLNRPSTLPTQSVTFHQHDSTDNSHDHVQYSGQRPAALVHRAYSASSMQANSDQVVNPALG